jgi:hypothetical protein
VYRFVSEKHGAKSANDAFHLVSVAMIDVTERKQMEEILKQRTKDTERSDKDICSSLLMLRLMPQARLW